jgi:hypothetical protein
VRFIAALPIVGWARLLSFCQDWKAMIRLRWHGIRDTGVAAVAAAAMGVVGITGCGSQGTWAGHGLTIVSVDRQFANRAAAVCAPIDAALTDIPRPTPDVVDQPPRLTGQATYLRAVLALEDKRINAVSALGTPSDGADALNADMQRLRAYRHALQMSVLAAASDDHDAYLIAIARVTSTGDLVGINFRANNIMCDVPPPDPRLAGVSP